MTVARLARRAAAAVGRRASRSGHPPSLGLGKLLGESPWGEIELARLVKSTLLGVTALGAAWFGASGATGWSRLMLWMAIGIGALLVAGLGMTRWLIAGLASVRCERRRLLAFLAISAASSGREAAACADEGAVCTAPGMARYHRLGCELAVGKALVEVGPEAVAEQRLLPCGICAP